MTTLASWSRGDDCAMRAEHGAAASESARMRSATTLASATRVRRSRSASLWVKARGDVAGAACVAEDVGHERERTVATPVTLRIVQKRLSR
jgi:hypothetical protein